MEDLSIINQYVEAAAGETSVGTAEVISATNNLVYRVDTKSGQSYVLKCVEDPGLDVQFGIQVNRHLQRYVLTQEIISADTTRSTFPCDVLISRYYRGTDVASLAETGRMTSEMEKQFTTFLFDIFQALQSVSMPNPGYGIYKNDREMHPTWHSFMVDYIERYGGRLETLDPVGPWRLWKLRLLDELAALTSKNVEMIFKPVSLDTNLKNFLYLPDSAEFVALNIPLVAVTDERHGIAEIASQLHGRAYEFFLQEVSVRRQDLLADQRAFAFYKALSFVGVLAYVAAHEPQTIRTAQRWGYPVPFYATFEDCIKYLQLL